MQCVPSWQFRHCLYLVKAMFPLKMVPVHVLLIFAYRSYRRASWRFRQALYRVGIEARSSGLKYTTSLIRSSSIKRSNFSAISPCGSTIASPSPLRILCTIVYSRRVVNSISVSWPWYLFFPTITSNFVSPLSENRCRKRSAQRFRNILNPRCLAVREVK